jgi:hypothetical protein
VKDLTEQQVGPLITMVALHLAKDGSRFLQPPTVDPLLPARSIVGAWRSGSDPASSCKVILWKNAPFLCATLHHDGQTRATEFKQQYARLGEKHHPDHLANIFEHESALTDLGEPYQKHFGTSPT